MMSSLEDSAVLEPPAVEQKQKEKPAGQKPKLLPPYAVVVLNDDEHTFAYVIQTFTKVFGYERAKCTLLAMKIHTDGRAVVWSGPKEVAELKRDLVRSAGTDFFARDPVKFPLGVLIEPMPG
jgi:ATP-dependent Clp protease adaptor protein ClpS